VSEPFNAGAFPGVVVDWAVVTDRDLVVADQGIDRRIERWAKVATRLHGAETITGIRDDLGHRYVYVATRPEVGS
jgi:hypothetical protein